MSEDNRTHWQKNRDFIEGEDLVRVGLASNGPDLVFAINEALERTEVLQVQVDYLKQKLKERGEG